ncbi:MAG: molybdopterin-binding protein [Pseudomonadota bacterium]
MSDTTSPITAACLVIGDEILSGRTREGNAAFLAGELQALGIDLREIRVVPDEIEIISAALKTLSKSVTYVFTSGGIGPTHDDITADAVAHAFDLELDVDPRAVEIMAPYYAAKNLEFTDARKRMARMPASAELIENPISRAPGFKVENVHVLAGVPNIFRAMLEHVLPTLQTGVPVSSRAIPSSRPEGEIGSALGELQKQHTEVSIGSYPRFKETGGFSVEIVLRSRSEEALDLAEQAVRKLVNS